MAERFEDLPLDSRVEVIYEREVHVERLRSAGDAAQLILSASSEETNGPCLVGWYAIVDAEGDLVCLVPPGGTEGTDNDDVQRASVVAEMLNQGVEPAYAVDHLRILTPRSVERGATLSPSGSSILAARQHFAGMQFSAATMVCTFEDLQDADLMRWLRNDVATRLVTGGKLTLQLV